ncbi:MAG: (Fe-S)-binding protein [Bacteroidia bacterium]|nr:(Fe-S)-binding protein [Bacteroidia bacterium]
MSKLVVYTMAELAAQDKAPEILYWVGCAGSFDPRAQKVTIAFCKLLEAAGISYAILGNEESCSGDPARRAGNEFLFQMLALQNIETLKMYDVKNIVTTCPHCYNTLRNEYAELGGSFEVIHHTEYLDQIIASGKLKIKEDGALKDKKITYHDSCYIGRVNGIYDAPRSVLNALNADIKEMDRSKSNGLCCGAGGAQMFKEDEPGDERINEARAQEILDTGRNMVAANCPFCITMLMDGMKAKEKQDDIMVYDLAELIVQNNGL